MCKQNKMNNIIKLAINDELKIEKFIITIEYLCKFVELLTLNFSKNSLYIQCQNFNHVILFELNIPNYWFDYYQFEQINIIQVTVEINKFYNFLERKCNEIILILFDTNNPSNVIINANQYENTNHLQLQNHFQLNEQILNVPSNDNYQYHLVIEQHILKNIINELIENNTTELSFHCSNILEEVILYGNNKAFTILQNYNNLIETDNFILTFSVNLLLQLPLNKLECVVIYIYLNPNMPIKFAFSLDENDDLIDFNINISPNEVHNVNSNENDFLNMCLAMSHTSI